MIYLIAFYIFFTILYSVIKKNNTFNSFTKGIKDGIQISLNMFSTLLIFTFAITCINNSGILNYFSIKCNNSAVINLVLQMIIRPLSSSSSYAILMNVYDTYGINSIYGHLSTFIHCTCDTLFYIITIYSSYCIFKENKKILIIGLSMIIFSYILIFIISYLFLI